MKKEVAKRLAATLLNTEGTFNRRGETVTFPAGYQVGRPWNEYSGPMEVEPLARWLTEENFGWRGYFGSWVDEQGRRYIEASDWFVNLADALQAGRQRNQQAVWDWADGRALYLNEGLQT